MRREGRQIGLKDTPNMGTLYCEEICSSYKREKKTYGRGDEIFTAHFAASIGGNEAAKALSESLTIYDDGNIKSVSVLGQDGKRYLLIANSNEKATIIDVKEYCTGDAVNLKNGENVDSLTLNAWEAVLLRIK